MRMMMGADIVDDASLSFLSSMERELAGHLEGTRERIAVFAPESLPIIQELSRLVDAGGKRLRPLFVYWGYRAGGGLDGDPIARAGAAVELLHTAALIHDDVIDRADLRRGEPSTMSWFAAQSGNESFGASAAILAGDLAQALAEELLCDSGFPPSVVLHASVHFGRMRIEAISGEFMDLRQTSESAPHGEARARRIAALKSGSYSVVGPLLIGASLAAAGPEVLSVLRSYGEPLGEAFQLRDDVLGTFGEPATTGKDRDGDIRLGKRSAMVAKAIRLLPPDEAAILTAGLGLAGRSEAEIEQVRGLIESSGALAETLELIESLSARARAAIETTPIGSEARVALAALADRVAVRES